jgi:5'-deoxy-5'-methylthioadenosine phosphorylase
MLAIIGGSGLTQLSGLGNSRSEVIRTPYGDPSASLVIGTLKGVEVFFLARHGARHTIAPHEINYRANIWALKAMGASRILSIATVGGIGAKCSPGSLVIPHQIIDYTWGRMQTFFDNGEPVTHIDFTEPYSEEMRAAILAGANAAGETVLPRGVYAVTQGPRLETAAEIDRMERDGADLVGMTAMPEAALSRELGIAYAAIAVVVNFAAGRGDNLKCIDLDATQAIHREGMARVGRVIEGLLGGMK